MWILTQDLAMYQEERARIISPDKRVIDMSQTQVKPKNLNRNKAQEVRSVETSLISKEEVFRMLALAEATGLPLLLVGDPGVAKTKTIIDWAKAWLNKDGRMTQQSFMDKVFILETDEGTKSSEIKGMPDLGKLFAENTYELCAPVTEAEVVVINEVDKASSNIRNSLLGVMNERFLFNGRHKVPCKWKLFVATCNEIPKEEADNPFWDRFVLKMHVPRVSQGELVKYFEKGARDYRENFTIGVPTKSEMNTLEIPSTKLEHFLSVGYQKCSDRTLTYVPNLTRAVSFIWDVSVDKALVKVASIMISNEAGSELQNKLMTPEVKALMNKVETLWTISDSNQIDLSLAEIEALINSYAANNKLDKVQADEIEGAINYILDNHPIKLKVKEIESVLEEAMAGADESVPF